jgi:hypothetical protein
MMRWVRWLLAWLAVIGLSWDLAMQASAIARVISSVGGSCHTVRRTVGVIFSTSPLDIHLRADVLDVSALSRACVLAGDGGPPWLDTRGPPTSGRESLGRCRARRQPQGGDCARVFQKFTGWAGPVADIEFCNSL